MIAEAAARTAAIAAEEGFDGDDYADVEAELLSLAEATLTATLACFEGASIPTGLTRLPRAHGSRFLSQRIELAQLVLDRVRDGEASATAHSPAPRGYRDLVFPVAACVREAQVIESLDRRFVANPDAGSDAEGFTESLHSHILGPALACIDRLHSGSLSGAVEVAYRADLAEPLASLLRAIVLLASGRESDALLLLDRLAGNWGQRFVAMSAVLRACAQLRRGFSEPARTTLQHAEGLPVSALVHAMSTLRTADALALAAASPVAERLYETMRTAGMQRPVQEPYEERPFQAITAKEMQLLAGLREGLNTRQIAERLFLSVNTVRTHVRAIGKKLVANGQAEMVRRAEELRLFDADGWR